MRIGVDVDGVLADFNAAYIDRVVKVTGRDLFPPRPFDILTWNYPESYGYTKDEVSAVWENIKADTSFWVTLSPYIDAPSSVHQLRLLEQLSMYEIYFITARPGTHVRYQTERWLSYNSSDWGWKPTVLISSDKAACARALSLDKYIDDKTENVQSTAGICKTYIMDRTWNRSIRPYEHLAGITRVTSVEGMFDVRLNGKV